MDEAEAAPDSGPQDFEGELERLRQRVGEAELRAEGARAGLRDLDALRMLDEEDRRGAIEDGGAARAVAKLRAAKPWLFTASTSPAARRPAAAPQAISDAMRMSREEWRAGRAALLRSST